MRHLLFLCICVILALPGGCGRDEQATADSNPGQYSLPSQSSVPINAATAGDDLPAFSVYQNDLITLSPLTALHMRLIVEPGRSEGELFALLRHVYDKAQRSTPRPDLIWVWVYDSLGQAKDKHDGKWIAMLESTKQTQGQPMVSFEWPFEAFHSGSNSRNLFD